MVGSMRFWIHKDWIKLKKNMQRLKKNMQLMNQRIAQSGRMDIKKRMLTIYKIGIIFLCFLCLSGCGAGNKQPISQTGFYFDTVIQITVYDEKDKEYIEGCLKLADKYEKMLSPTVEGSDIWNINHSKGRPVIVSEETAFLLNTALSYCEMTNGRIDPTVETVSKLWNFHGENIENGEYNNLNRVADNNSDNCSGDNNNNYDDNDDSAMISRIPDEKDIAEAVMHVDYHNLLIEGNSVTLCDTEAAISLGFIAKGFIADKMKEYLLSKNVKSAIINLGGNLLAVGSRLDGTPFQFGVQKPFDAQGTPITVLSVSDKSVVSSGIYERYFYENDTLYHHILNPYDGYPVQNNLLGVTILSDSSIAGDALSTSCFVLGLEEGMKLIESLDGVDAIFITKDYELHCSSGADGLK